MTLDIPRYLKFAATTYLLKLASPSLLLYIFFPTPQSTCPQCERDVTVEN